MLTKQKASVCVGSPAPDFTLRDPATGEAVGLSGFAGRSVLLVFFRGTWCPFCREQMRVLQEGYDALQQAGITVVGVVCQNRASVERYLAVRPLPFPLLADEKRIVARLYGTHYWFSPEGFHLSHPALFVIQGDGVVSVAHVGRNMRDLPVDRVLKRFVAFVENAAQPA